MRAIRHRLFASTVLTVAIVMALALLIAATVYWAPVGTVTDPFGKYSHYSAIPTLGVFVTPGSESHIAANVFFHLNSFAIDQQRLQANVGIHIPSDVFGHFIDTQTGVPIDPTDIGPSRRYHDLNLTVEASSFPSQKFVTPFLYYHGQDSVFAADGLVNPFLGTVTLPVLEGLTARYPMDIYWVIIGATVTLPSPIGYKVGSQVTQDLPAYTIAIRDVNFNAFDVSDKDSGYELRLTRPLPLQIFVLTIAALPLIVVLMLAHLALLRGIDTVLLLLFTALFTILPLRAVLVPPQAAGLTLVDLILGSELVLLLLVGVVAYWRDVTAPRPRVPPRGEH